MGSFIEDFNTELVEEVHKYSNEHSVLSENAFVFLSYLTEHRESRVANAEITNVSSTAEKFKVNAYVYDEYFQTLTLVVSLFNNRNDIEKLNKTETAKLSKYASKFF